MDAKIRVKHVSSKRFEEKLSNFPNESNLNVAVRLKVMIDLNDLKFL